MGMGYDLDLCYHTLDERANKNKERRESKGRGGRNGSETGLRSRLEKAGHDGETCQGNRGEETSDRLHAGECEW